MKSLPFPELKTPLCFLQGHPEDFCKVLYGTGSLTASATRELRFYSVLHAVKIKTREESLFLCLNHQKPGAGLCEVCTGSAVDASLCDAKTASNHQQNGSRTKGSLSGINTVCGCMTTQLVRIASFPPVHMFCDAD